MSVLTTTDVNFAYDALIRTNRTIEWDTVTEVAHCHDGIWGAWGEVIDQAEELGFPLGGQEEQHLASAFMAYQLLLRAELGEI